MLFTSIFLYGLVATATALPQKRERRKCSSVFPSTTGTIDHVSTTPTVTSASSTIVTPSSISDVSTPSISTPIASSSSPESSLSTPPATTPVSTTETPITSSLETSTPVSSDSVTTPSSTAPDSTTPASSTIPSTTPSTTIASTIIASTTVASTTVASTSQGAPRPRPTKSGDVPVGVDLFSCTVPGVVALVFETGPYEYTAQALDLLDGAGMKGNFLLNGQNHGSIYDYSGVVQRMYSSAHLVGSSTWSHANLANLDKAGIESELIQLETALRSIIGVYGNYLFPPSYGMSQQVRDTARDLAYKIILPDIDIKDESNQNSPQTALNNFIAGLDAGGTIALAHDSLQTTVQNILPGMINALNQRGLRAVTLAECFGVAGSKSYSTAP